MSLFGKQASSLHIMSAGIVDYNNKRFKIKFHIDPIFSQHSLSGVPVKLNILKSPAPRKWRGRTPHHPFWDVIHGSLNSNHKDIFYGHIDPLLHLLVPPSERELPSASIFTCPREPPPLLTHAYISVAFQYYGPRVQMDFKRSWIFKLLPTPILIGF
ncbi:hypothetical protein AVEN_274470-1 [Araneus ventricosus]|uniref:Uncharacterized protein n=1 Tax=Araneus ventricosus TaxID=182803 RepID=A0A4Y2HCP9_ARAVE|nr:hypothetical protein AVEN_274470-1 [Araneus ventricosus]